MFGGVKVEGNGTLFDPDIVDVFLKVAEDQWWKIACDLADEDDGEVHRE